MRVRAARGNKKLAPRVDRDGLRFARAEIALKIGAVSGVLPDDRNLGQIELPGISQARHIPVVKLPLGCDFIVDRNERAGSGKAQLTPLQRPVADQVLILAEGRAVARGAPADVLTRETVERVFSWPVAIEPFDGRPQMIPLRQRKDAS